MRLEILFDKVLEQSRTLEQLRTLEQSRTTSRDYIDIYIQADLFYSIYSY